MNWSVYGELEPDEDALENDGNFEVLAGMGLLSRRATGDGGDDDDGKVFDAMAGITEDDAETNPFLVAADPAYGNQVGTRSNNEDEQDYCDIKDLLRELDDEIVETSVTVSELLEWTPTGTGSGGKGSGAQFQDFLVVLETDESSFDVTSKSVRRRYAEFVWLADAVAAEVDMPLPMDLPEPVSVSSGEDHDVSLMDHCDDLGNFITSLAEDPDFQLADCVQKFLLSDDPVDGVARPAAFTTAAIEASTTPHPSTSLFYMYIECSRTLMGCTDLQPVFSRTGSSWLPSTLC